MDHYRTQPMFQKKTRFKLCLLIVVFLILYVYIDDYYDLKPGSEQVYGGAVFSIIGNRDRPKAEQFITADTCYLPPIDLNASDVAEFFVPHPQKACNKTFRVLSSLTDGLLVIAPSAGSRCSWQCIEQLTDTSAKYGSWHEYTYGARPPCDWIRVLCFQSIVSLEPSYQYLHNQIYIPTKSTNRTNLPKYDVYLIGLDAISHNHFKKTMPLTDAYLRDNLKGVSFPYLSKVGYNSQPNQLAVLMGKRFVHNNHSPWSFPPKPASFSGESFCTNYYSLTEQFLPLIYAAAGYRTAHIEDEKTPIQAYPHCKGFGAVVANHTNFPYHDLVNFRLIDWNNLGSQINDEACQSDFDHAFEYFEEFVKAKTEESKFGYVNFVGVGHRQFLSDPMTKDGLFRDFLERNAGEFKNAFVFVWSDHGYHGGKYYKTATGQRDTRNPLMTVVLPEDLKSESGILANLKENSKRLVSHYDVFATFVDLAISSKEKLSSKTAFQAPITLSDLQTATKNRITELHGASLLRPLPSNRIDSCPSLGIPFVYCLCYWSEFYPSDHGLIDVLIEVDVPNAINAFIETQGATDKCQKIFVDSTKPVELAELAITSKDTQGRPIRLFRTNFWYPFDDVQFQVYFELMTTGEINLSGVLRYDNHRYYATCVSDPYLKLFCVCK
uniref:Sulfatase domain-containing protein n=1 Tax=Panagrellus redivivus TaxID=6233 RepID=A0A7E4W7P2_PANRE